MTPTTGMLAVAISSLLTTQPAHSQAVPLTWLPPSIHASIASGSEQTLTVHLTSNQQLNDVELKVVPSLASFISTEPRHISLMEPGQPVLVNVHVRPSLGLAPGLYEGAIQATVARAAAGRARVVPGVLPVSVQVNQPPSVEEVTFFSNFSNPLLLGYRLPDSTDFAIFGGPKIGDGSAVAVDNLYVQGSAGEEARFRLDADGRPLEVFLPGGAKVRFDWTSFTDAVVSFLTADGSAQASVAMHFSALSAIASLGNNSALSPSSFEQSAALASTLAATGGTIRINVTANGQPVTGAAVNARISDALQSFPSPVTEVGGGVYEAPFLEGGAVQPETVFSTCTQIVGTIVTTCQVLEPIAIYMVTTGCLQLGAAIPPAAGLIVPACEAIFGAAAAACFVPAMFPDGAEEGLCSLISNVVELLPGHNVIVHVSATKNGFTATGVQPANTDQDLVSFSLELPLPACDIQSFSTNPVDPAPFQSYTASVTTSCTSPTDTIQMTVIGTDGYTDSRVCMGVSSCSLAVPGAEENIVDTITVTTSGGSTRTIVLVF